MNKGIFTKYRSKTMEATVYQLVLGGLTALLTISVGWQVWNAISMDGVRGRLQKQIDGLRRELSSLKEDTEKLRSQITRENEIRWIYHDYIEELCSGLDEYEGSSERAWNSRVYFHIIALNKICNLADEALPPEKDRVWSQYVMAIVYSLHTLTDDWRIPYLGDGLRGFEWWKTYQMLERMDAYPMDSEALFYHAREYIKQAALKVLDDSLY